MSNFENSVSILDTTDASGCGTGGALTVSGGAAIGKSVHVGGDMEVQGSTVLSDNILVLNANPADSVDTGILFQRTQTDVSIANQNYASFVFKEQSDEFVLGFAESDPNRSAVSVTQFAPLRCQFLALESTSNSTSATSGGALNVCGGVAIAKDVAVGGALSLDKNASQFSGMQSVVNGATAENVQGLLFPSERYNWFSIVLLVRISTASATIMEKFTVEGLCLSSGWELNIDYAGEETGLAFAIAGNGQIIYSLPSFPTFVSGSMRYFVCALNV